MERLTKIISKRVNDRAFVLSPCEAVKTGERAGEREMLTPLQ
jgi:hypothetical protein